MNTLHATATPAVTVSSAEPRVYEVQEFVNLQRGQDLVRVRHVRTRYHADGRISQETLSTETLLEQMIRAFRGNVHQSAGTVTGFFDTPEQARECAQAIAHYHHKEPELCGTQIAIAL